MISVKKKSPARLSESFIRSPDYATYLVGLKLPPEMWAVFALTEQPVTAEHIVDRSGLDLETAKLALRRLVRRKLIQKHVVGWQDYVSMTPALSTTPSPAPVARTAEVVASPAPTLPTAPIVRLTATPKKITPTSISFSLRNAAADTRRRTIYANQICFKLTRTNISAPPTTKYRLRPILDMIIEKGGGGLQGQLLAYRVFLRIPAHITASAGLSSLSLVDDDFTVSDPKLIEALFEAARSVAGLENLPQAA